ncbi:MAG: ATP-dependent Clp protease proteolytic subunit [Candidatus Nomurabacteria bacterium GW2011_GWB1_37_5]|uniref:ATP-dependent Clp protease proteolytic subunit n=1 Tax=Candidatus Nomurabacteria bacterium GW2011_GWB1_37_5 TaxID=1618742 RepID=A0A0G0GWP0_9BACT|nr:MAG: ATP-dependent Clp protease proteolytic subunit [Candidatus Nomurabacteria bacterium GW2011_GWB1_37_5]
MERNDALRLLQEKRIFPVGNIDQKLADELRAGILLMAISDPKKEIHLIIDSTGGSVNAALSVYDFIRGISVPIIGIVNGRCHSSALIIYACCTRRLCLPNCLFLFHAIASGNEIKSTNDVVLSAQMLVKRNKRIINDVNNIYSDNFGINKNELKKMEVMGELYEKKLFSDEAKKLGIVHEIIDKFPFQF